MYKVLFVRIGVLDEVRMLDDDRQRCMASTLRRPVKDIFDRQIFTAFRQ